MLTAEYGGTGGRSIESKMVVEEPDIEIGAGVSSKGRIKSQADHDREILTFITAISRRMQTDRTGYQGPRTARDGQGNQNAPNHGRYRQPDRDNTDNSNNTNNRNAGVPPPVPPFGNFNFAALPGGFQFPPGFVMPPGAGGNAQPPPPGAA